VLLVLGALGAVSVNPVVITAEPLIASVLGVQLALLPLIWQLKLTLPLKFDALNVAGTVNWLPGATTFGAGMPNCRFAAGAGFTGIVVDDIGTHPEVPPLPWIRMNTYRFPGVLNRSCSKIKVQSPLVGDEKRVDPDVLKEHGPPCTKNKLS
jgi:hypothetical protein